MDEAMAMNKLEQAEQTVLYAKVVGTGLQVLLSHSMAEQARLRGGTQEEALATTRAELDRCLDGFSVKTADPGTNENDSLALQKEMHRRIRIMLTLAEDGARKLLGLPPQKSKAAH